MKELLTKKEIAKKLEVPETTIDRWLKKGIPSVKSYKKLLFSLKEVDQWLKSGGRNPP